LAQAFSGTVLQYVNRSFGFRFHMHARSLHRLSGHVVDHYKTLGIVRTASRDQARAAYLRLVKEHHPDRSSEANATERFRHIRDAWEILGDAKARVAYDRRQAAATDEAAAARAAAEAAAQRAAWRATREAEARRFHEARHRAGDRSSAGQRASSEARQRMRDDMRSRSSGPWPRRPHVEEAARAEAAARARQAHIEATLRALASDPHMRQAFGSIAKLKLLCQVGLISGLILNVLVWSSMQRERARGNAFRDGGIGLDSMHYKVGLDLR